MKEVKIIAHCLVRNEERFIWYSLNSVLPYVDQIIVWDTNSTDNTVRIIQSIKSKKISFREVGPVDLNSFTDIRNKMIQSTPPEYTWMMVLDGDEVWSNSGIKKAIDFVKGNPTKESIVVRTNNLVGDIYHRLPESAGHYHLAGRVGHLNLRFLNLKSISGLHLEKPHGQQGFFDKNGLLVQERDPQKIAFLDVAYHHATHLIRSNSLDTDKSVIKRAQKYKYELGDKIPVDQIPQIFFSKHPKVVPSVIESAPFSFWLISALLTLPKRFKRFLLPSKHGY